MTSPSSPAVAGQWERKRQHLDDRFELERGLDRLDRTVDPSRAGELQRPGADRGDRGPISPDRESRAEHRAGDDASDPPGRGE